MFAPPSFCASATTKLITYYYLTCIIYDLTLKLHLFNLTVSLMLVYFEAIIGDNFNRKEDYGTNMFI